MSRISQILQKIEQGEELYHDISKIVKVETSDSVVDYYEKIPENLDLEGCQVAECQDSSYVDLTDSIPNTNTEQIDNLTQEVETDTVESQDLVVESIVLPTEASMTNTTLGLTIKPVCILYNTPEDSLDKPLDWQIVLFDNMNLSQDSDIFNTLELDYLEIINDTISIYELDRDTLDVVTENNPQAKVYTLRDILADTNSFDVLTTSMLSRCVLHLLF